MIDRQNEIVTRAVDQRLLLSRARAACAVLAVLLLLGFAPLASAAKPPVGVRSTGGHRVFSQIVGGVDADPDSLPWLAYVSFSDSADTFSCTGTVISSNLILTAGHCVDSDETGAPYSPGTYSVITGTQDLTDTSAAHVSGVTQTFVDGYSTATDDDDVGILELSTPTTAPAIPLATSSTSLYAGNAVAIAGWGLTDPSDVNTPAVLQFAQTVVQRPGYCAIHGQDFDAATELCTVDAPYDDTSSCYGDSGGPVIANELQGEPGTPTEIGIIDEGDNCSTSQPGYSARTDAFLPWAEQLIATLTPPRPVAPIAPAPATHKPETPLGAFPVAAARKDARAVLQGAFTTRFRRGQQITLKCNRVTTTRISCATTWTYGPTDFYGSVTTYLVRQKGSVVWTDHYFIRSVSDNCYFHTNHRRSCSITRRAGTY
jgi:secreted trypsin-like serine protease